MWLLLTGDVSFSFFLSFSRSRKRLLTQKKKLNLVFPKKKKKKKKKKQPLISKKKKKKKKKKTLSSDPDQGPGRGPHCRARGPLRPPPAGRGSPRRPPRRLDPPDDAARRRHPGDAVRVEVRTSIRRGAAQVSVLGARPRGLARPDREAARFGREDLQEDLPRGEVHRGKGKK